MVIPRANAGERERAENSREDTQEEEKKKKKEKEGVTRGARMQASATGTHAHISLSRPAWNSLRHFIALLSVMGILNCRISG